MGWIVLMELRATVALGIVIAAIGPSLADARPVAIVFESHVHPRDEGTDMLVAPVKGVLKQRWSMLVEPDEFLACAEDLPARRRTGAEDVASDIEAQVSQGLRHFRRVRFPDAIEVFEAAIGKAHGHPVIVAESDQLRSILFEAHIALVLAYRRSGDMTNAYRWMAEVIRTFPDDPIPHERFGPEPGQIRKQVLAKMRAQPRSTLIVKTDRSARVFVNERFVGAGGIQLNAHGGDYRVFATLGDHVSAVAVVAIEPAATETVELDPRFDAALVTDGYLGLGFPDEGARQQLDVAYARKLASMCDSRGAILLSTTSTAVVGRVVSLEGHIVRQAYVEVAGDVPVGHLYSLGTYLAGEGAGPGVNVVSPQMSLVDADLPSVAPRSDDRPFRFGAWKWLAVASGGAAVATGAYHLHIDGEGTCTLVGEERQCPKIYRTYGYGVALLGVGSVALLGGAYGFIHDARVSRRNERSMTVGQMGGDGWGITVMGSF